MEQKVNRKKKYGNQAVSPNPVFMNSSFDFRRFYRGGVMVRIGFNIHSYEIVPQSAFQLK